MALDLTQRLFALGEAHELVRPTLANQRKAASLDQLLAVLLGAYDDKGAIGDRIRVRVPEMLVGEGSITTPKKSFKFPPIRSPAAIDWANPSAN